MMLAILVLVLLIGGLAAVSILRNRLPDPPEGTTDESIAALVKEGKELQAIKWYRAIHHVSLKSAKEAVAKMKTK